MEIKFPQDAISHLSGQRKSNSLIIHGGEALGTGQRQTGEDPADLDPGAEGPGEKLHQGYLFMELWLLNHVNALHVQKQN